jgi:hypothetical protein
MYIPALCFVCPCARFANLCQILLSCFSRSLSPFTSFPIFVCYSSLPLAPSLALPYLTKNLPLTSLRCSRCSILLIWTGRFHLALALVDAPSFFTYLFSDDETCARFSCPSHPRWSLWRLSFSVYLGGVVWCILTSLVTVCWLYLQFQSFHRSFPLACSWL